MLCGLPGAGKTTLAKKIEVERNAIRLSPDEWIFTILADQSNIKERDRLRDPIEKLLWVTAQKLGELGNTVILENGFWVVSERNGYRDKAHELGLTIELHYLECPFEVLWERVEKRNKNLPQGEFVISLKELKDGQKIFEPPTLEELETYDFSKKYE